MNKTIISGRLTKEPECRYTQATPPMAVLKFTLAVDRIKKGEADFISCVAFDKRAEFIQQYISKGTKIIVEGHIQTGKYQSKDDVTIYTTDVIVDQVEPCEKANTQEKAEQMPEPVSSMGADFINIPDGIEDEGLPFN